MKCTALIGRHCSAREYLTIKQATHDLIDACGGVIEAARHCRSTASRLSEAASPYSESRFAACDQIADLERLSGQPIVTRHLAGLAGYDLVSRETRPATRQTVLEHLSQVIRETADVSATIARGMADGSLDAAERREIIREIDEAVRELLDLKTDMAPGLKEAGP